MRPPTQGQHHALIRIDGIDLVENEDPPPPGPIGKLPRLLPPAASYQGRRRDPLAPSASAARAATTIAPPAREPASTKSKIIEVAAGEGQP
jgi:hypothetical protein